MWQVANIIVAIFTIIIILSHNPSFREPAIQLREICAIKKVIFKAMWWLTAWSAQQRLWGSEKAPGVFSGQCMVSLALPSPCTLDLHWVALIYRPDHGFLLCEITENTWHWKATASLQVFNTGLCAESLRSIKKKALSLGYGSSSRGHRRPGSDSHISKLTWILNSKTNF